MSIVAAERVLWVGSIFAVLLAVSASSAGRPSVVAASALPVLPSSEHPRPTADSLLDAVGDAVAGDLFRREREPVKANLTPVVATPGSPAKPQLVLRGLVGGTPPEALVEGIPGVDGAAVLRVGETLGGVKLRSIRADTAILIGKDTTWKLSVRRLWEIR